ncbi:MAG: ATP-binding protein [Pirellulaceae bacterium]|nr:ATP-binding protein [Pirellulaceae bacterium]
MNTQKPEMLSKLGILDSQEFEIRPEEVDLKTVLEAWQIATERLQKTHESLRGEVVRLSDELEEKNRQLARKNRLADLGQMASHVAHEVRNNLMPMTLYFSLLRRHLKGDEGSLKILSKMAAGLTSLEATVNDLLHFTSDREPTLSTFFLAELCHQIKDSLLPQFEAQGIQVEIDISENFQVEADRDMLRRAILNLVLNGIDVMPNGGRLAITAWEKNNIWGLAIADSGKGVSQESQANIFEPFYSTKSNGTGLGLAIVARTVEVHHGTVTVDNCPDGGAAFTLSFPRKLDFGRQTTEQVGEETKIPLVA